jgi:predicted SnoaL-like aldol condensation-catalyzing enzyme
MKHLSTFVTLIVGSLVTTGCAMNPHTEDPLTARNRALITDFARLFYTEKDVRAAFEKYVAPDYIQHNPNIVDGRDAAVEALTPLFSRPDARFDIKRILVDGDYAVIHLHGRGNATDRGGAVADLYRLQDGKIVEHWDVIQPIPEKPVNPHAMF